MRVGAALLAVLLAVSGCAVNPVTGQRELILMSPAQEEATGRDAAKQVEAEIGLVRDPDLEAYVRSVGERLASRSPRQDVTWHFAVADMPEPNAFALPGGWIYVSRGLLVIANSEDELANVIGHEIGHVAARHLAKRQTRALGVGLLAALGTLAAAAAGGAEAAQTAAQLGQVAGAGLIASYSRDQERESDDIGQRLAAETGFDPAAMADFLRTLGREGELREGRERLPSFLDSHPVTAERVETAAARARTLATSPESPVAGSQGGFLRRLDGILVGTDPAEGVFEDGRFLHPGLDLVLEFPAGWKTVNQKTAVMAQSPEQDAMLMLEMQEASGDPEAAAARFARANGLALREVRRGRIGDLPALRAFTVAQTQQGELGVDLTWYAHSAAVMRLTGLSPASRFSRHERQFERTASSLRSLTSEERAGLRERRLRVVSARAGEGLSELSQRTGNRWNVEETAVANGMEPGARLSAGQLVKIAVDVPYAGDR